MNPVKKEQNVDPSSRDGAGPYQGEDRRTGNPDRRKVRRGGRRASDRFKQAATFVYKLLTEPPG